MKPWWLLARSVILEVVFCSVESLIGTTMSKQIEASKLAGPVSMAGPASELRSELRAAATELFLEPGHDAGMHLADTTFTQVKRGTNFLHRQFFVIIQNNDQAFIAV